MYSQRVKKDDSFGFRMFACDFETTTAKWRKDQTKVWSFCVDEVGKYEPMIYGSIEDFFDFCSNVSFGTKKRMYFHNLKFDGQFILYHLLHCLGFKTALNESTGEMVKLEKVMNGEVTYLISDTGQWYYIGFRINNVLVEVRDSLKILPFTLAQIGKAFCTKYKKSTMEYDDHTTLEDCSESDIDYIKNDVLVLSEGLSFIMKTNGEESPFNAIHSLTIGGACLQRFKQLNYGEYNHIGIELNKMLLPESSNSSDGDQYIRRAYRGGYCYVNETIERKTLNQKGFTADVNSLYPFAMCTKYSGNSFPFGQGKFKTGKPPADRFESDVYYFYLRVKVMFELKDGFIPTVQKKNSYLFKQNEYLKSSRAMDFKSGRYVGKPLMVEMTFSKDDFILFCRHYNIIKIEYLDYIEFTTANGLFDFYIEEFAKIKQESKGATRSLAKLFSNNLYGQLSKSDNSSFKIAVESPDGSLGYKIVRGSGKKIVNIAIGACITAKARRYQIETIQNNIERFCYSDTDSLHCIGSSEDFVGTVDDKQYGAYKIESIWNKAKFVRQKTYIEELNDGTLNICCAGMTEKQKDIFRNEHTFEDFDIGLVIKGGKLRPRTVKGGVILEEVDFTLG